MEIEPTYGIKNTLLQNKDMIANTLMAYDLFKEDFWMHSYFIF